MIFFEEMFGSLDGLHLPLERKLVPYRVPMQFAASQLLLPIPFWVPGGE